MPQTASDTANDQLLMLVEGWFRREREQAETSFDTIERLEDALRQLADCERWLLESTPEGIGEQSDAATKKRIELVEQNLLLSNDRIRELEKNLQERTEELLQAQQTNSALSAKLLELGQQGAEALEALANEARGKKTVADRGPIEADPFSGWSLARYLLQKRLGMC